MNFDALTAWLALHPEWILGSIALLSFLESLLLVGLIAPGIALLFVVASLAGSAGLPLWQIVLISGASATAGDVLSFYLGRHFHHRIAEMGLLRRHPQWLERAETFIRRYGMPGLAGGRFIGPLRPFMPMMAGTLEMPPWRFWLVELLTLLPWGMAYMAPGYAVGAAADHAEQTLGGMILVWVALWGCALGGMILVWVALWGCALLLAELVLRSQERATTSRQQIMAGLTWAGLCAALFSGIMACVVTGYATDFNHWAGRHWFALRTDWLDTLMVAFTGLGEFRPMLIWVIVVTVVLLAQRCLGGALLWLAMTNGGNQMFSALKRLTSIERPQWVTEPPVSLSFPSGHASMALVFAGTLCVVAWPPTGRRVQRLMLATVASYAFLQATSRTYLGVHWAADIGAGLLLGGALVAMAALLKARFPFKTARPASLAAATLIAWAIALLIVILPSLSESLLRYSPVN